MTPADILALDANRYSDYMRGVPAVCEIVDFASQIALPFVVLAELRAGFRHGRRSGQNEIALSRFLSRSRVQVLWADDTTTQLYGEIFAELRRSGRMIPTNDIWIAALCIQRGVPLFSRDAHFDAIPRLPRV